MTDEKTPVLPRGDDVMRGLWPRSVYIMGLDYDVVGDEQAEELVGLVGYLESRERALETWYKTGKERIQRAKLAVAGTKAFKSLPNYVREHPTKPGGKSLVTACGEIKLRKQRDILKVYDEKLAKINCPEAVYAYQVPAAEKLSKDKLKEHIKANGPLLVEGENGQVVIAEIVSEIETMVIEPSEELLAAGEAPRLLVDANAKENGHVDESTS